MRKIKTAEDIARAERRNKFIGGLIVIVLLTVSSLGYSLMSSDNNGAANSVEESGLTFVKSGGLWVTEISGETFYFQYLPSEVADVSVDLNLSFGDYAGSVLYFVNSREGTGEILNNFNGYILRYQEACLDDTCGKDLPVKDCSSNLIVFAEGDNYVGNNGSCVYITGDLKATDAFLYEIFDIV